MGRSLAISGVRGLSEAQLRQLARDLEEMWRHAGYSGPEGLNEHHRGLYEEARREWAERGVQLRLFVS